MSAPVTVISLAGGLCTIAHLYANDVSEARVRRAVARGEITRVRRGHYSIPDAPLEGVAAVRAGGRLAGLSAAGSYGIWGGWGTPLHVTFPRNAPRVRGGERHVARGEWTVDGRPLLAHWNDDRRDVAWSWRVGVVRCLRQIIRWHDLETACAAVDTALTGRLLSRDGVRTLTYGLDAGTAAALDRCRSGAGSGVESLARQRLERIGLDLRLQVPIAGVGDVDLAVVGTRIFIEIDGYHFHRSPEQFANDRQRDAEARSRGYVPLRFAAVHVRDRWSWVERMILDAIAQDRARPTSSSYPSGRRRVGRADVPSPTLAPPVASSPSPGGRRRNDPSEGMPGWPILRRRSERGRFLRDR